MKFLFSILLLITTTAVFSQSEKAIVEQNRIWSTLEVHCLPNGNNYSTYFIKFEEDTIIDGFQYKRMWRCIEQSQSYWLLFGFIREDENKKVYLRPPDYFEGMVYDFGCSLGDTIVTWNIYLNNDSLHFVVTNIDSVLLLDGYKKRITLYEYNNQQEEIWVEGLGSYYGILNSGNSAYGSVCGAYEALCYEKNGNLIYQNPYYTTCYYDVSVGIIQEYADPIKIYPNPAKQFVNIETTDNNIKEIKLMDLNGKIISKKITADNSILLNLQKVDKGYYFIKILSERFSYPSYKLIVD